MNIEKGVALKNRTTTTVIIVISPRVLIVMNHYYRAAVGTNYSYTANNGPKCQCQIIFVFFLCFNNVLTPIFGIINKIIKNVRVQIMLLLMLRCFVDIYIQKAYKSKKLIYFHYLMHKSPRYLRLSRYFKSPQQ